MPQPIMLELVVRLPPRQRCVWPASDNVRPGSIRVAVACRPSEEDAARVGQREPTSIENGEVDDVAVIAPLAVRCWVGRKIAKHRVEQPTRVEQDWTEDGCLKRLVLRSEWDMLMEI